MRGKFGGGYVKRTHDLRYSVDYITDICSTVALRAAWQKFSRGKKARADVQAYQQNLQTNLRELQHELVAGTYSHGRYAPFEICDPKPRQIHKARVRDRLVHQVIVSAIESLFERRFVYDSYSCRKGKGTHAGVRRLRAFLRQVSANNTHRVFVLKCDIRHFSRQ